MDPEKIYISGRPDAHEIRELTARDGVKVFYRRWIAGEPSAVVLYLHGQGDHSGAFAAIGDILAGAGLAVYAIDHRGFGLSLEPRGDIPSYELYLNDVEDLVTRIEEEYPGRPVFLVALSMGGHLAFRSVARLGKRISGVVALSPGFKGRRTPLLLVARVLLYMLINPRKVLPSIVNTPLTTRNQVHLAAIEKDLHWVLAFTARFYWATLASLSRAFKEMRQITCPVLVLQGGVDHIIDPVAGRRYFDQLASIDKEFRILSGVYHNLIAEPEMPDLALEIAAWIQERATGESAKTAAMKAAEI